MRAPTGLCQLAGRLVMAMIDVYRTLSCRGEGREVSALFAFRSGLRDATRARRRRVWRDWVGFCFVERGAFGGAVRTRGFGLCGLGLRRLFDNFIGRKRDVDGGVLAGLSCFETLGC